MSSILRISKSKTIQLINEWEKFECLWNTKLKNYPARESRTEAVKYIAQKLNIPNFTPWHVVTKFKNLRNSYRQELKKIALNHNYQPKVIWFHHMDRFLRPHLQNISVRTKLSQNSEIADETTEEVTTDIEFNDMSQWSQDNSRQSDESFTDIIKVENTSDDEENCNGSCAKRIKLSEDLSNSVEDTARKEAGCDYLETTSTEHNSGSNMIQKDHYDAFGAYIAAILRTLPPQKALMMQPKIVNFLISAQVEDLNQS